ncbi:hypothetical protein XM57_04935 [Burkholderia cepacia]|nr:hypothetical protein XM57_04935 [Burkholderia cepacia]ETP66739.1 hypothetical protein BDSB_01445 [Burkholderia dolosa PC543]
MHMRVRLIGMARKHVTEIAPKLIRGQGTNRIVNCCSIGAGRHREYDIECFADGAVLRNTEASVLKLPLEIANIVATDELVSILVFEDDLAISRNVVEVGSDSLHAPAPATDLDDNLRHLLCRRLQHLSNSRRSYRSRVFTL